ncbi:hypothetical protein [Massilioclostridium coli]|uniref:hypothetical protein n=1 Tax=Massilioclostridium coli TaxID=1870991 RepID=UPI0022E8BA5F|nr:hypothetical protein [Massilioclostridium coli]
MSITKQTRNASYRKLNPLARQAKILEVLGNKEMTSREIATLLGYTDMNAVRPRITELVAMGKIATCGAVTDPVTGRTVAVYRRIRNAK